MEMTNILIALVAGLFSLSTTYLIYTKAKSDSDLRDFKENNNKVIAAITKDLVSVAQKQVEHEFNFVTEKHVREILKEEVKDIKADIITVKGNVSTILESLQNLNIAIGIQNGLREKEMQRNLLER